MQRILHLDGIRGLLAMAVAYSHFAGSIFGWTADRPLVGAYLAVDFFFILSGYVLTHNFKKKSDGTWLTFFAKRLARLWPLHLFCLALTLIAALHNSLTGGYTPEWWTNLSNQNVFLNALFLQNIGIHNIPAINEPSWSISIEFWVSTLILYPLARLDKKWLSLATSVAGWSYLINLNGPNFFTQSDFGMFGNMGVLRGISGISFGAFLIQLNQENKPKQTRATPIIHTVAVAFIGAMLTFQNGKPWIDPITVTIFGYLIYSTRDETGWGKVFSSPILVWLGEISFSIYLCHTALIILIAPTHYINKLGLAGYLVFGAILTSTAHILNKEIEKPTREFFYKKIKNYLN